MITGYYYEVWKGGKLIGEYWTMSPLRGAKLVIPYLPILKQPYGKKVKKVEFPLGVRVIDYGEDVIHRTIIVANRKSKNQLKLLGL